MTHTLIVAAGAIEAGDLLRFWSALAVLLIAARGLGMLARRAGQPAVIGELAAGVALGPTLMGRVAPEAADWLFGGEVASVMLGTVAWLGVVLLLAITGFETDLGLLRRLGKAAAWTSLTSLLIPFALGLGLAASLPQDFRGEGDNVAFVLFMGVALAISALPVVAKVLREMGVIARPVGQVTLAAGMVNDLVGWVLLGLVAGLARTGQINAGALGVTVLGIVTFLALAITVGQRAVDRLLRSTAERDASSTSTVAVAMIIVVVAGAITQALGVEAVLGAFVAGILLSRSPLGGHRVEHQVASITDGFLAPIFFATAGLQVDLFGVVSPDVAPWAVAVVLVATVGKVLGGYLGGRLGGMSSLEGLAVGVGLNARGALEIVVATIGLGLGVLSEVAYSVIVVMAVLTSMMAPPALTLIGRRMGAGAGEDRDGAAAGEARRTSRILSARAALLPTRGGESSVMAGHLLDQLLPADTTITALTVHPPELDAAKGRAAAREVGRLVRRRMVWRDREGERAAEAILTESRLGYDVIAVGATAEDGERVLSPVLAELLISATAPVLIVRGTPHLRADRGISTIVAAVDGTSACDAGRDVAASLAVANGATLDLVHVTHDLDSDSGADTATLRRAIDRAALIGRAAQDRASDLGAEAGLRLQAGADVAAGLMTAAHEGRADLIVIGTQVRAAGGDVVLGRTVEQLLRSSEATVLVVAFPVAMTGPA